MKYKLLPDEPVSQGYGKTLTQGVGQGAARIFETLAGTPGNILSAGLGAGNFVTKKLGFDNPISTYEDIQKELPASLPTSSQLREGTKRLTGENFEPQSEPAKFANNVLETTTSLATPLGPLGGGLKIGNALKGALTGEAVSYLSKKLGGSDTTQGIAKLLGTIGGTLAFQGKDLSKLAEKNYNEVQKSIEGKKIPAKSLKNSIEKLWEKYTVGDSPAKKFAQERLLSVDGIINEGKIDAGALYKLKKNANEHWTTANKAERKVLKDIIDIEKETLKGIGADYSKLEMADDIYKSFQESGKALSFIQKHAPSLSTFPWWLKGLFGAGSSLAGKLPHAAAGYGTYKVLNEANMIRKFLSTPSGIKYYGNVLKDGFSGNARGVAHNMAKLNNAAQEFEDKQPKYKLLD